MLFAYFGPETTLPIASALMTVVGGLLVVLRAVGARLSLPFTGRRAEPRH